MSEDVDWARVAALLDDLYTAADGLERIFPGRKFTLDGHLVGSIGEVVAAYMFDLDLNPASTQGHDARARDGRQVEIKLTRGRGVAIRHEPEHLTVLQRPVGTPVGGARAPTGPARTARLIPAGARSSSALVRKVGSGPVVSVEQAVGEPCFAAISANVSEAQIAEFAKPVFRPGNTACDRCDAA
ncbi:DUF6998 domain-containing protein [Pseudophaeobacter sp.]|uniref:DUF6998 domain-containing protein n=1 Tax=Pseudophaeobacter sp. TaxID=1971739 RepID=UPI003A9821C9